MSIPRRGIPNGPSRGAPSPARSSRAGLTPMKPSLAKKPSATRLKAPTPEPEPEPSKQKLSLKEQIALKRAEQQKKSARSASPAISSGGLPEIDQFPITQDPSEDDILGRLSVRETIDRARLSGSINLAARDLTRLPTYLFESHLSVTPEPLLNSPPEVEEPEAVGKAKKSRGTAWYEQADLTALKAPDNLIVELQPELSLFGSLKVIDFHRNKLQRLPQSIIDLVFLTAVDLSENALTGLPTAFSSLPNLSSLNVSHNQLTGISFTLVPVPSSQSRGSGSFFSSNLERATETFPALKTLKANDNQIKALNIDFGDLPRNLAEVDFSSNDLGNSATLVGSLAALPSLQMLWMASCNLELISFPPASRSNFPKLRLLDVSENPALEEQVVAAAIKDREIEFGTTENLLDGCTKVIIGKKGPMKETWEIEAERRVKRRPQLEPEPEPEPEPESGPLPMPRKKAERPALVTAKAAPVKETWELEVEQGLMTEGGRRRARALAAAAEAEATSPTVAHEQTPTSSVRTAALLTSFFDGPHSTLILPQSQLRSHNRSFSSVVLPRPANAAELLVPSPTLPLVTIVEQPFLNSIRTLVLTGRRMDTSFGLPSTGKAHSYLPNLDELRLDNCNLANSVQVTSEGGGSTKEPLIELIGNLFPSLGTLDLSYNALTSLTGIATLFTPDGGAKRKGLKVLRVRGNRVDTLETLEELAGAWRSGSGIQGWQGEEIDLRENELIKLPPLVGLLPLDVLLVEGNAFRVPARRIWEKEGTAGLRKWLVDRIE